MNVIAKISCYLERSVVTLKLRKEYLNMVTTIHQYYSGLNTEQCGISNAILCQHIRELQTLKEQSGFLANPVQDREESHRSVGWILFSIARYVRASYTRLIRM